MRKAFTPVVAITLLIFMTVAASVLAFIWMTNTQTGLQESAGASVEESSTASCSRLNLITVRGDGAVVQNTGCDTIDKVVLLIDGLLTDYDLDYPLTPGQSTIITFASLEEGVEHSISVVLPNAQTVSSTISASKSTLEAGFCSNVCGDGVCCYSNGESWDTCISDCIINTYLIEDNNVLYSYELIDAGAKRVIGNRTSVYSSPDLIGAEIGLIDDKTAIALIGDDYPEGIFYSYYYDGVWSQVSRLTPDDGSYYYLLDVSPPDIRGVVHWVYQRCTQSSIEGCDLFLRSWSYNNGLSPITQLTNVNYASWLPHDGVKISVSNNAEHKVVAWITNTDNPINYKLYEEGSWSNIQTLNLPSPPDNGLYSIAVNNEGEAAVSFYKHSLNPDTYHLLHYNGTWSEINVTTLGYPFAVSSISNSFLLTVADNFGLANLNYNSTTFEDNIFTPLTPKTIRADNLFSADYKNVYDELLTVFYSTSEGVYAVFLNDTSWDYMFDVTWAGAFGCEEYERCSADCAVETWCSDGVDNDEDGYYDSDDTDCP